MKHILPSMVSVIGLVGLIGGLQAQNSYSFEQGSEAYSDLVGGTPCDFSGTDFHFVHDLDGETLRFYGLDFTLGGLKTIIVGRKAFIRVDNDSSAIYLDALTPTGELEPVDGTSDITYQIIGAVGERILKAQWRNWRLENGPANTFANCQIWYHQSTGVIEMRYGPNSGSALDYDDQTGPNCGIFHAPDDFLSIHEKLWLKNDALAPTLDSLPIANWTTLHNLPAENTVYRFTPRFPLTSVATVAAPQALQVHYASDLRELTVLFGPGATPDLLVLRDAAGRLCGQWSAQGSGTRILLPDMAAGVYMLSASGAGQRATPFRFVVR
ncbi:MAG TPA: hypothetical protein PKE21_03000 [Flavobacteriales bacterium]|nr:hypothetical protein [Flavobacteriales bacterium]HMR26424.1 hypothetical protein [Flavobacteriales bacterium]